MSDRDRYPQILDRSGNTWHLRSASDTGDGPSYPTACGTEVTTLVLDVPEGVPNRWESRCGRCYQWPPSQ